jgi:single-strand DNA-binding protein
MNKIQVIGNITRDAVIKETNGRKVINFSVAVNENYKDKDGNKVEKAVYYNCAIWKESSQSTEIAKYLSKGVKVFAEGKPSAEIYKTKENQSAIDFKIVVNNIELLSSVKKEENGTVTEQPVSVGNGNDDSPF